LRKNNESITSKSPLKKEGNLKNFNLVARSKKIQETEYQEAISHMQIDINSVADHHKGPSTVNHTPRPMLPISPK
jgi:hypothetical protein